MAFLDIPYLVELNKGKLYNATLIGMLVGEIEPPEPICFVKFMQPNSKFALMDVLGIDTGDTVYFAKGKALVVVDNSLLIEASKKPSGRLALALTGGRLEVTKDNLLCLYAWGTGDEGAWSLYRAKHRVLDRVKHAQFIQVMQTGLANNWDFVYPELVPNGYQVASDGVEWKIVGKNNPPKPKTLTTENMVDGAIFKAQQPTNFGVSTKSDVGVLIANKEETKKDIAPKKKKHKNRLKLKDRSISFEVFEDELKNAMKRVDEMTADLRIMDYSDLFDTMLDTAVKRMHGSWMNTQGYFTGRALFKSAVETSNLKGFNKTEFDMLLTVKGRELPRCLIELDYSNATKTEVQLNENSLEILLRMIELNLSITAGKLNSAHYNCRNNGVDLGAILESNVYNLSVVDPSLGVEDLDKLAMMFGMNLTKSSVLDARDCSYMHNYMLNGSNEKVDANTVIPYEDVVFDVRSGFVLSKRTYDMLMSTGTIVPTERITSLAYYLKPDVTKKSFTLSKDGWRRIGKKFAQDSSRKSETVVKNYIKSGLGVKLKSGDKEFVSDYIFLSKELYVYSKIHRMASRQIKSVRSDLIDKCIKDFEKMKAKEYGLKPNQYKLEERQAEAVHLINNPVLAITGVAGGGKTTTAEAVVYAYSRLLGISDEEIFFVAPTGKAANRLGEVVKRPTNTLHGVFGISGEGVNLRDESSIDKKLKAKLLLIDESSMPNINLLYEVMLRVEEDTIIVFLGDIEQLPPIGFGKPFATMLTFLPSVFLNVSKRASELSGITKNADEIINNSDGNMRDLKEYLDFKIRNTKDVDDAINTLVSIVNHHLHGTELEGITSVGTVGTGISPDDIQVITPFNTSPWGTVVLNKILQNVFNPKSNDSTSVSMKRGTDNTIEFREGDRVIHTKENQKTSVRLLHEGGTSFVKSTVTGVANGDMGKVLGIIPAVELDFDKVESDVDREELQAMYKGKENTWFVAVQYSDVSQMNTGEDAFVILYRAEEVLRVGSTIEVVSSALNNLDLAYALTVHKLQGSQATLVICLALRHGPPAFIQKFLSRNMLYTSITRGEMGCYLIGEVYGINSVVNRGREYEQTSERLSVIDLMIG